MFTMKTLSLVLAAAAAAVTALPTATTTTTYSNDDGGDATAPPASGTTHLVAVGRGGLLEFQPSNIVAQAGDVVEFHFGPRSHSVVQSAFETPCEQLLDGGAGAGAGFNSGLNFTVAEGQAQAPRVFQVPVVDPARPVWFFCGQADHCNKGMVGAINASPDGARTLDRYRDAATRPGVVTRLGDAAAGALGARILDNPRPLDGF